MTPKQQLLVNLATGRRRPSMPRPPVLSSERSPWDGLWVEEHRGGPAEANDEAPVNHLVVVQLDHPSAFEWKLDGRSGTTQLLPGQVSLFPSMCPITARNRDTREFLTIALDPKFVLCAAHDIIQFDRLELAPRHGVEDLFIRGTALALRTDIEAGHPSGRAYGEALARALAVHLVRHYSAHPVAAAEPGGLSRTQLRRAIEFVHERLSEDLPVAAMAAAAGLSPFHFARLFKRSTGFAPHQYLVRRRIERGRELLIGSELSIAQISSQVGFCDQSHFTCHFKRVYGVTPRTFLREFAPHQRPV